MNNNSRIHSLDILRGLTIISMILYHACWDLTYFKFLPMEFLQSRGAYIWQQSICWTFILLSGFCVNIGHHQLKRGLITLGSGVLVTLAVMIFMKDSPDIFGVLWLLGSAAILIIPIDKMLPKKTIASTCGLIISVILFFVTRSINLGYLGFESLKICELPKSLYSGYFMTYLGFQDPTFYSSDYFSLIPWFFLFSTGYFIGRLTLPRLTHKSGNTSSKFTCKPIEFLGRHSLIIYLIHQPIAYGVIYLIYTLRK